MFYSKRRKMNGIKRYQFLTFLLFFLWGSAISAQSPDDGNKSITYQCEKKALHQALSDIERLSNYYRMQYIMDDVKPYTVTVSLKDASMKQAMQQLLKSTPLKFEINQQFISIYHPDAKQKASYGETKGWVFDENGEPMIGVNVAVIKDGKIISGVVTDTEGKFNVNIPRGAQIKLSFVGYSEQIITPKSNEIKIAMKEDTNTMDEVVVTGIFERKKEGFTGSANRMSGDEIRKLSSGNILNAITMLDPGFRMEENMLSGSNPSSVPDFSMRGQSSMGDYSTDETVIMRGDIDTRPNQPLFVLDGIIDVGVTKIMDLDPAQIESVTLLKDAAAMAIYGSQASNGVVVVETKAPAAGTLRVTYNGNYKVEYPDLTDYNLLNAAEKLEIERRAGFYDPYGPVQNVQNRYDTYRRKFLEVQRGVNTYWLSQPLETVFAHRHGINLEGGNESLRYKIYAGINQAPGVMKETGVYGKNVSIDIRYRYKGLLISNIAYVDYTKSDRTSPYGTFDQYARLNPYYRIYDENGQISQYLEKTTTYDNFYTAGMTIGNPMYNTLYNTMDQNIMFEIRDAFRVEYSPIENLRLAMKCRYMDGRNLLW